MRTYSHVLLGYLLARHGFRAPRRSAVASAAGSALPDVPAIAGATVLAAAGRWSGMPSAAPDHDRLHEQVLDQIFFTGPVGTAGLALHSAVPVTLLLLAYALARVRGRIAPQTLVWFLVGWVAHVILDFLTHADDARPPLWPLSDWRWQSPVSYWDPEHFGTTFTIIEHGAVALTLIFMALTAVISRLRGGSRRRGTGETREGRP